MTERATVVGSTPTTHHNCAIAGNNQTITIMKKNEISFRESVNAIEIASVNYDSLSGINYAKLNKALRGLLLEYRKFKACVKVLDTLAVTPITLTVGDKEMTHIELLKAMGVEFDAQGHIIADSIKALWTMRSEDGYMKVYKNVTGTITREGDKPEKVYHWDSKKKEYQTVRIYTQTIIEKWSVDILLKGLAQLATIKEQETHEEKTRKEWNAIKKTYIFDKQTNKGGIKNTAKEVAKDRVVF